MLIINTEGYNVCVRDKFRHNYSWPPSPHPKLKEVCIFRIPDKNFQGGADALKYDGLLIGNSIVIEYNGTIDGTDTTNAKVLKVSDYIFE